MSLERLEFVFHLDEFLLPLSLHLLEHSYELVLTHIESVEVLSVNTLPIGDRGRLTRDGALRSLHIISLLCLG